MTDEAKPDLTPDRAAFAPGTHGCHEALHMALMLAELVDTRLCQRPAIALRPEWEELATRAMGSLHELHQAIGAEHLE